jgi:hypothetical protein
MTRNSCPKRKCIFYFFWRPEVTKGIHQLMLAFFQYAKFNYDYKLLVAGDGSDLFTNEIKTWLIIVRFLVELSF